MYTLYDIISNKIIASGDFDDVIIPAMRCSIFGALPPTYGQLEQLHQRKHFLAALLHHNQRRSGEL